MPIHQILAISLAIAGACLAVVVVGIARAKSRARREEALEILENDGWEIVDQPKGDERRAIFEPFAHARALPRKDKGVRACLRRGDASILEYVYTESSGNSSRTVRLLACATPCPKNWPDLTLTREHALHRLGAMLGIRDIEVEDPAFNARWRVRSPDETFAILFLTPEVQQFLMDEDTPESWWITGGSLVCVRRAHLDPAQVSAIERRTLALRNLAPSELDVYTPEDG